MRVGFVEIAFLGVFLIQPKFNLMPQRHQRASIIELKTSTVSLSIVGIIIHLIELQKLNAIGITNLVKLDAADQFLIFAYELDKPIFVFKTPRRVRSGIGF